MLLVAHRTCPRHAPENSIEGILTADRLGADAVEVDVRLTADGVPVLAHDQHLLRTAKRPMWIHRTTSRALATRGIPRLRDALQQLPPDLGIALDLKADEVAAAAVALATELDVIGRTRFWTREPKVARALRDQLRAGVEVALLRDTKSDDDHRRFVADAVDAGADAISAAWSAVDDVLISEARAAGVRVYSWCRTRGAHVEKQDVLDGLVTDWPEDFAQRPR